MTKESVRAFIARAQKLFAVAYIEDGLTRDQIIVLEILCGLKDNKVKEKMFEYFTDQDDITIPRLTSWSESIIT